MTIDAERLRQHAVEHDGGERARASDQLVQILTGAQRGERQEDVAGRHAIVGQ
ncbi:MAG: hypothetical protein ACLP01_11450 [Solirubrobacteraceae bacterium]